MLKDFEWQRRRRGVVTIAQYLGKQSRWVTVLHVAAIVGGVLVMGLVLAGLAWQVRL